MAEKMEFGVIGLGRMGGDLGLQAVEKGIRVVGYDKGEVNDEYKNSEIEIIDTAGKLKEELETPRIVFIYVPAGNAVDSVIENLSNILDRGDVVVDGGNSYWGDSIRRAKQLEETGILFVDCGTSGGVQGARYGACFMAGGEPQAIEHVEPILTKLAVENGYVHAGPVGAGHFTKLVHNGIEFGMLQAIAEGIDLLTRYHEDLDISNILRCWNHGSVIRSWLTELMEQQYNKQDGMESIPGFVEDTGEVNWLVSDAMKLEADIPVIAQSVMQLFASRDNKKTWARAIAMMRHGFGEHPFGSDEATARERREGRIGDFPAAVAAEGH